jgi:hypothetical protein
MQSRFGGVLNQPIKVGRIARTHQGDVPVTQPLTQRLDEPHLPLQVQVEVTVIPVMSELVRQSKRASVPPRLCNERASIFLCIGELGCGESSHLSLLHGSGFRCQDRSASCSMAFTCLKGVEGQESRFGFRTRDIDHQRPHRSRKRDAEHRTPELERVGSYEARGRV